MDLLKLIKSRRSVRNYENREIKKELLFKVLEAARWAPSAVNRQPWKFIIVTDRDSLQSISSPFTPKSPIIIVVCAKVQKSKWALIDCSLAAQNIMLEAFSLGLGTCFVGAFNENKVKNKLKIPKEIKVLGLITLGYPKKKKLNSVRIPLEKIVDFDKYSKNSSGFFDSGLTSFIKSKIK